MATKKLKTRIAVGTAAFVLAVTGTVTVNVLTNGGWGHADGVIPNSEFTQRLSADTSRVFAAGETVTVTCKPEALSGGVPFGYTADLDYDETKFTPLPESMAAGSEFWEASCNPYADDTGNWKLAVLVFYTNAEGQESFFTEIKSNPEQLKQLVVWTVDFVVIGTEASYPNHFTLDDIDVGGKAAFADEGFGHFEKTEAYGVAVRVGASQLETVREYAFIENDPAQGLNPFFTTSGSGWDSVELSNTYFRRYTATATNQTISFSFFGDSCELRWYYSGAGDVQFFATVDSNEINLPGIGGNSLEPYALTLSLYPDIEGATLATHIVQLSFTVSAYRFGYGYVEYNGVRLPSE
jgi:hypothetical protein